MKCRPALLLSLFLMSFIPFAAPGKQPRREVADAHGLLEVHTFCIDQSALTPHQSADLVKFVAQGGKPKGLFTKLTWQYVDNCSNADATVKLTMVDQEGWTTGGMVPPDLNPSTALKVQMVSQAKMFITNRASGKTLYQVEGGPVSDDRQGAFASPFSKLLKDLKTLSK